MSDAEADRCWGSLRRTEYGELVEVRTLAGGASGSAVYQLKTSQGDEFVLKVNRNPEQANRELIVYRDLAALLPVRLPTLIAEADHCLLLKSAGTPADAARFSTADWKTLAIQLGHLLAPTTCHALVPPTHIPRPGSLARSAQIWAELGHDVADVLADLPRMDSALAELPTCLCHGDFHLGNLLVDPAGDFVWIDWQETGPGHGPEDLALLWQRAEAAGLTPPRDTMLTTYAKARGIPNDTRLRRATTAAELQLLLLSWPHFLGHLGDVARTRLSTRLESSLDIWRADP
ncbi:aminoglycoside phosphotransferase family protein [Kribbella qitaiheensis]|uniref:Aminoglycoside phosphotransferase family protein n=1 Tax=Kribbella qitaiheensis TaxID=1544730 RepID=A0A7G6WUQ5_9ACTN|nr:aminoglycoside phosphotransferase family protein [Kribbella qitaiheensis]QNE17720.1 aminoglycoside phosphotransferase family protein [Kribbella qitaiheensis]